ncbi:DUF4331 domain-containing protein [Iamia majanohamensis]|uniref:DUF4331 domain-containing protein n=1 Tax=Iamia majanohamensis TaxID=467976 RepID=A0AAE9YGY0_9ACTN|nr:DUF4331 domain-containing protein [Iamia majanohamensis]WCO68282.1 DUF4331 domain-containing protein [Iamia majanohamensis]
MRARKLVAAAAALSMAGVGVVAGTAAPSGASSHREAPLISEDPVADNTDVYMFRDVNDPSMVNIVANYIPLEQPAGGPNFSKFGDDVLYEIHVDNDGDVVDDITYQFRFRTQVQNPDTFLYNTFTIDPDTRENQNIQQVYSVRKIEDNVSTMLASNVPTPPVNIGPRSTPSYNDYVAPAVTGLAGGGQVFAGQRDDSFFFDLGSGFDLLGLRPINDAHVAPLDPEAGRDGLAEKSTHAIILQVPISEVSANGDVPTTVDDPDSVIGIYASSARQRVQVLSARGTAPRNLGQFVQVSRLGLPLVNEVLIPLGRKDLWNGTNPKDDAQFFDVILDPEPTRLLPVVYPSVFNDENTPDGGQANRPDLIQLLTGQLNGLSEGNALPPADLLRLNLAVPPVQGTPDNSMGALDGDTGGFPNGRRLTDDVFDIELQVLAGVLLPGFGEGDPSNPIPGTEVPYSALSDGVQENDQPELPGFPYQGDPVSGYDQIDVTAGG